jgi:hypothetical protein
LCREIRDEEKDNCRDCILCEQAIRAFQFSIEHIRLAQKEMREQIAKKKWQKNTNERAEAVASTYLRYLGQEGIADQHNEAIDDVLTIIGGAKGGVSKGQPATERTFSTTSLSDTARKTADEKEEGD